MGMKVLLADDSGTMRKIIIRALNALGVTDVTEANDGAAALDAFGKGQFNLVITDWNMPAKNGLEVIKGIRQAGSKTPIIMATTEGEKKRVLEAIQAGVTDYIVKPFTTESLREKLAKFVS
jgi:two-component system chemotaxis response regulator CheY